MPSLYAPCLIQIFLVAHTKRLGVQSPDVLSLGVLSPDVLFLRTFCLRTSCLGTVFLYGAYWYLVAELLRTLHNVYHCTVICCTVPTDIQLLNYYVRYVKYTIVQLYVERSFVRGQQGVPKSLHLKFKRKIQENSQADGAD